MTDEFDLFCEKIITELLTPKNKRAESRYWGTNIYPSGEPRKVASLRNKSSSQRTKLGNQQYIGNIFSAKGVRGRNQSEKDPAEIAIGKGLDTHTRISGTNPKKPGATVNSKQADMEVKYTLPNGVSKVGRKVNKTYTTGSPKMKHWQRSMKKFPHKYL